MKQLTDWMDETRFDPATPWLVLGKGPTFAQRTDVDFDSYHTLGLNHVVREQPVDIAHMVDVDVVEDCADVLEANCRWLLMPREPHVQNRPSYHLLEDFVAASPVLRKMDEQGRLIWYDIETGRRRWGSPVVEIRYFSSEAALGILGLLGARTVRSLGIDGGRGYSGDFANLERSTMLSNTQPNFDRQFTELDRIAARHEMDYRPLIDPVRVFVGLDRSQVLAARVLEHSIRSNTNLPVRFHPMLDLDVPMPKDRANRPRTGFSFHRFAIPELCGYRGRAIYLDADMQVFTDIAELWTRPFEGATVMVTNQEQPPEKWKGSSWFHPGPQMSVMVLDCDNLDWDVRQIVADLDAGRYDYKDLMFDLCVVEPDKIDTTLPVEWNHLEHYVEDRTKLLHYTVVPTQPWKTADNDLAHIWLDGLRDAAAADAIPLDEVRELVREGHVRGELVDEVRRALPSEPSHDRSVVEMELAAARARIDQLEAGPVSLWWHRVRRVRRDATYIFNAWRRRSQRARAAAGKVRDMFSRT